MSRLRVALQIMRLGWMLLGARSRIKRAFRLSRRAFAKALQEGGVPQDAAGALLGEYDTMRDNVLNLLGG